MEIVIVCSAMAFGPDTVKTQSLGGSETAALMLGKELAKRGNIVKMFCNLPKNDRPDYWPGGKADDGVNYLSLEHYQTVATLTQSDLTIIVRDPRLAAMQALTRKKVLWMHDIATQRGMKRALEAMQWTFDEIWTVSEWHRQQVHEATDYPLDHIVALRNGIVPVSTMPAPRSTKQLVYAARPERGLDNLIMPGGVMENLPDYNLVVCMYDHFPPEMKGYYEQIFARMKAMPNVEFLGPKPQRELRQLIHDSAAYIYPTQFEETSCILARECIEQQTPFITTDVGALRETLGKEGIFFEDWLGTHKTFFMENMPKEGTPEWCKLFAEFFRDVIEDEVNVGMVTHEMGDRIDLTWEGVAELVEKNAAPQRSSVFSRAWSLMQDGDVIAAREYLIKMHPDEPPDVWSPAEADLWTEISNQYPFILDPISPHYKSMKEYYAWVYEHKKDRDDSELVFKTDAQSPRLNAIMQEIAKLPAGAKVVEYGCGPGHLLAALAVTFPQIEFFGIEISEAAVDVLNAGAQAQGIKNLAAMWGSEEEMLGTWYRQFDAVIVSEVLEHVLEPWATASVTEMLGKEGARMIITTPFGPWEQSTIRQPGKWHERAHIWHLDARALRDMFGHKDKFSLLALPVGQDQFGRPVGNSMCCYDLHESNFPPKPLEPLYKAFDHIPRQTTCACVIAMNNETTILRMLNSIEKQVQFVRIALGPSTDRTRSIIEQWRLDHPWVGVQIIDAPKIEPYKFGFDDARLLSSYGFDGEINDFDWFIWIDTDEYLSGNFSPFLRNSALTGYVIPQHHFTVEPRGAPTQIDRPARLLRVNAGYRPVGHIHEHFQLPDGVGRVYQLPDVDIGHAGYVNEVIRKERFMRNFEFLKWDHEGEGGKRTLHSFLWFRDIVHRLRIQISQGDMEGGRKLAEEGLRYYQEHWKDMLTYGQGLQMSLAYVSEIRNYLGRGVPLKFAVQFDDRQASFDGRFEDFNEIERMLKHVIDPEIKDRTSKYH